MAQSRARPLSWASYGRTRAAALCRHLFPSPWPPRRRAAAWPAEGPVGPEMWHRQARERPTGRGALQVYPVLKENKIFSWETFPLCFSSPHLFLLFLSPGLSSRVSFVFPSLEPPPRGFCCLWVWPSWSPDCVEAGTPLHTICAAFTSPSRTEGGSEDGWLATGPLVRPSSLSASCAFLLSRPATGLFPRLQTHPGLVCLSVRQCSACDWILCSCPSLPWGDQISGRLGCWLPAASPPHLSFSTLSALCTSEEVFELLCGESFMPPWLLQPAFLSCFGPRGPIK